MSKSKTTWIHAYDIIRNWFIFRADFISPDGRHLIVKAKLNAEDLNKRGRLAVKLRKMQRVINKEFEAQS